MSDSSDFQSRTASCSNHVDTSSSTDHLSSSGDGIVSHLSEVESLTAPLVSKDDWEPTPFRESASLGIVSHLSEVESLTAPLVSRDDWEPAPFREGASLVLLPGSDNIFVPSTSSSTHQRVQKLQNSHDDSWEERFQELLKFKAKHGHCLVPHAYPENSPFARWAKRQRFQYKQFRDHKSSAITEERIHKLESVGFVWDLKGHTWETRLTELMEFKMVHGHCNVPCRYRENLELGTWVKRQRQQYKKFMSGAPTTTPPGRFRILTDMGFQWEILATPRRLLKKGKQATSLEY